MKVENGVSFAAHPWMENCDQDIHKGNAFGCESTRNQSCRFSDSDSHLERSQSATCKSSFSNFLVENGGGVSFGSSQESSAADFTSPIPSMPSFTFSSPSSAVKQGNIVLNLEINKSVPDEEHIDDAVGKYEYSISILLSVKCHGEYPLRNLFILVCLLSKYRIKLDKTS